MARFAIQSRAFTAGAGAITDELRQLFAHRAGFRLFITALHIMQHAFERMAAHGGIAAIVHIFKFNVLFAGTVQHDFMYVGAEACPRRIYVELIVFRQRLEHLKVVKIATIPTTNRAACQRQVGILDHAVRIEILLNAEAVTGRAGACRVVEREQTRFQLAHTVAANRTGKIGGEQKLLRFLIVHIGNNRRAAG